MRQPPPRTRAGQVEQVETVMRIAWTGHRPDIFHDPATAREALAATARELVHMHQVSHFLVGGQRGVDTWAAGAAIDLGVPFRMCLPVDAAAFSRDWERDDQVALEQLLARASDVRVVSDGLQSAPEQAYSERNRLLVAGADLLVAVWTGIGGGGTAETIALARSVKLPIRELQLLAAAGAASVQGRGI